MTSATAFRLSTFAIALSAALAIDAPATSPAQTGGAAEDGLELVDPDVLRVCADPNNLPFSNEKGEGFENKLAALFAAKLGKKLAYTFYPQATGFVRMTLNSHRCDVIMGYPQGDEMVQNTNPYYQTAYALVTKSGKPARRGRDARRSAPCGQTHRHRRRYAARDLSRRSRTDGQSQAVSADDRYPRQFLRRGHDERPCLG